jgi:hypothetical protein
MSIYSVTSGGEITREYSFDGGAREVMQCFSRAVEEQDKSRLPPWASDFMALPVTMPSGIGLEFVVYLSPLRVPVYLGRFEFVERNAGACQGKLMLATSVPQNTSIPHEYAGTAENALKWGRGVLTLLWQNAMDDWAARQTGRGAAGWVGPMPATWAGESRPELGVMLVHRSTSGSAYLAEDGQVRMAYPPQAVTSGAPATLLNTAASSATPQQPPGGASAKLPNPQMQKLILDAYTKLSGGGATRVSWHNLRDELCDKLGRDPESTPILRRRIYAMWGDPTIRAEIEQRGLADVIHKPKQQ